MGRLPKGKTSSLNIQGRGQLGLQGCLLLPHVWGVLLPVLFSPPSLGVKDKCDHSQGVAKFLFSVGQYRLFPGVVKALWGGLHARVQLSIAPFQGPFLLSLPLLFVLLFRVYCLSPSLVSGKWKAALPVR